MSVGYRHLIEAFYRTKEDTVKLDDTTVVIEFKDNKRVLKFVQVWKEMNKK